MKLTVVLTTFLLSISFASLAESSYQRIAVDRVEQVTDPLSEIIDVSFSSDVKTVLEAVHMILEGSGYRLISPCDVRHAELLSLPLPSVQRSFRGVERKHALRILVEPAYFVAIDLPHRLIGFQLKPQFSTGH